MPDPGTLKRCKCGHIAIDHHFNADGPKGESGRGRCSFNSPAREQFGFGDRCRCLAFEIPEGAGHYPVESGDTR